MDISHLMLTPLQFKVRGSMRNLYPTAMPLWALLKGIQENPKLASLTAAGRALPREDFKDWKPKNLMSVYLAVRFRDPEGRADEANVCGYTGLAGFDFDNLDDPMPVLEDLRSIPQVICAGISASGHGVWCAAHVAAATDSEYRLCFARGVQTFLGLGLNGIDKGAHDPTRARFAVSSPECWWRYDADGDVPAFQPDGDMTVLQSAKATKRGKTKLPTAYLMSPELGLDEVRGILTAADDVADGDMNNEKARQCGQLKAIAAKVGVDPATYASFFTEYWDNRGSTHKKTVGMYNRLAMGGTRKQGKK